ncbi:hypothetical protein AWC30_15795 [Mycolicibacillus trivialis]|uniref:Transmembrane protein n=1 Tax=Mycolicibacillus trivialis TaxID=1798 RepID=A0A1X2EFS4_9MYCO|nr:hypothetical protein [Mycolicibacillus trivialis]ORX00127.1 hypothetical protein AWC30_15795 [Mycolicibacillus trivialis]
MTRARRWAGPVYALALTLLVTAPLLRPGYLLLRDAVSTPRAYLSDAALGLAGSAPRAVPQDVAVALASRLLDGGLVVRALLIGGVLLGGLGAGRLVRVVLPQSGLPGVAVGTTVAVWNPFVAERLLQGQWSLLVGYGCLPWLAAAVLRLRGRPRTRWRDVAAPVFWLAAAGLTPTGLLLAATVALAAAAAAGPGLSRRRCAALTTGAALVAAAPWLVAAALGPPMTGGTGVSAFAARAEPGLGTLGSLAGLAGIWNAEAVPGSRTGLFALVATGVLLAVVGAGLPVTARRPAAVPLLALAGVAVVVPALAATGAGLAVLHAAVDAVPGLGVLREGQKWVALAMPGYTLAAAGAVVALRRWLRPAVAAALCCAALIAVLPDLAWGVGGRVTSVSYPAGWATVAAAINADPRPVAVLPAGPMRRFDWAGPVLDPLPRWVRAEVLSSGDLSVSGTTVRGEGDHARSVQAMLLRGAPPADLVDAGVGWVVVEADSTGEFGAAAQTLDRLPVAVREGGLTLYRVGGHAEGASAPRRAVVLAAHGLWLALLVGAAVLGRPRRPDRSGVVD